MSEWYVDTPAKPVATVILAHGAGAGAESEFMVDMAAQLAAQNINVVRFNFPYMEIIKETGKKRPPDKMPKLETCFHSVIENVQAKWADLPLFIGGKSMGGRVATLILEQSKALGAIALGYPFHPPGKPEKLRTGHLLALEKPLLIIQGERDTFGRRDEVEDYGLSSAVQTEFLADGDHSFKPRKSSGLTQDEHIQNAARLTVSFIEAQK
ncbi:alpha/beta hydrolase [Alteromonas alba]|uniref:Alpha/beta hydrolase n=1 Tax=Alteromonas alba TaxID=2079529 RepID=A0A2S9V7T7_9ALTE|nr:alpha/beta family hydrolase [Alteromonas alba]PRO72498.1 alpha/beta hydrolase [Alteromonas alba]